MVTATDKASSNRILMVNLKLAQRESYRTRPPIRHIPRIGRKFRPVDDASALPNSPASADRCIIRRQARGRFANVTKTLQDWLSEGEQLYHAALAEYQSIEAQLEE